MEVPRIGVKLELQLLAYTTATATENPSCVCDLHRSSWQPKIFNPLREARDETARVLMDTSQIRSAEPRWQFQWFGFDLGLSGAK